MSYVVVVMETESDFPGVKAVYGPYRTQIGANSVATYLCFLLGLERGKHVQVSPLESVQ